MGVIEIFKLFGSIFVDTDEANRSISGTGKQADGLGKRLTNGIKTAGKWALGLTAAAAGVATAAFAMTNKVTSNFDDIAKTSQRLGVTTDYYQEMSYWADQNGISSSSMERAVGRLNQRIGMAADGNEKYSDALERLGVDMKSVKDGTMETEDAMATAIQSLSELESESEKAALAAELFGTRLGRDLMTALQDGSMSIDEAKESAKELGIVIDEDVINAGVSFQDNLTDLKAALGGVTNNIMSNLIPVFNSMTDWILDHMPQIQAVFQWVFDFISTSFSIAINWVKSLISWLIEWRENNSQILLAIWEAIQTYLGFVQEYWQMVWEFISELWEEHGQALLENFIRIFESIWETIETVFLSAKEIMEQVLDEVIPWIQEKLEFLREFWAENGEQIMGAVENAFAFIQATIEFVMPIIQGIIRGAWEIIRSIFDAAIGVIAGLVQTLSGILTGDFEQIKAGLLRIWESLWNGIKGVLSGAWNLLSGAFSGLWSNISGWFTDLAGNAFDWGKNLLSGFVDGIKSMGGAVKDAASNVVGGVKSFLGFSSPAEEGEGRHIIDWGRNMVDGFLDGVLDESDRVGSVMNSLVGNLRPTVGRNENYQQQETIQDNTGIESLLLELIQAVKAGKQIIVNDRVLGEVTDDEQGKRIGMKDRRVAY